MEVAPNVHLIFIPDESLVRLYGVNVYLVGDREMILVDSGDGREASNATILDQWVSLGRRQLAYLVITHDHGDHYGGIPAIKEATGAKVATHRANLARIEEELGSAAVDLPLEGGEFLRADGVSLEVVHTPGHSPGDVCLFDAEGKVLFTGDTVVGTGTVVIGLESSDTMSQYMRSLRTLLSLGARVLCPGHGPVVDDAHQRVQEVLDHRVMRENQVTEALTAGEKTAKQLVAEIYTDVDQRLHGLAESNVLAHLLKLENEGRVKQRKVGEYTLFSLTGR